MECTNSLQDRVYRNSNRRNRQSDWPVSIREFDLIINNLPKQIAPGPDEFTGEVYQTVKEEIMPILYSLCQIQKQRECFLIHSMKSELPQYIKTRIS